MNKTLPTGSRLAVRPLDAAVVPVGGGAGPNRGGN